MSALPKLPRIWLLVLLACLVGCDNTGSPGAFGTAPLDEPATNVMEFRGQRGCVDCVAIEAWLTLEQRGRQRRYQLVEHYRTELREQKFQEEGDWQANGNLLRLVSSSGGERVYLLLPDNRLQATDSRGRQVPALADEIMTPVGYSNDG